MLSIYYYGKKGNITSELKHTRKSQKPTCSLIGKKRMVAGAKYSESPRGSPSPQSQEKENRGR